MVLMFKEEKNIYNLVELTHESSIVQIKKSMRKVKCIKEKMNYTLKDMLKENLSIIPAYAKNTGLHVFIMDIDEYGALIFLKAELSIKDVLFAFDNSSGDTLGDLNCIEEYLISSLKSKAAVRYF